MACVGTAKVICMVNCPYSEGPVLSRGLSCRNEVSLMTFFNKMKRNFVIKPSKGFSVFNNTHV